MRAMIAAALVVAAVLHTTAAPAMAAVDTTRIAVIGDSATTGHGVAPWESWASRLEARHPGDNVLPLGIDGATARRWLQTYLPQLDQLRAWKPTVVLIALGGNEYLITRPAGEYADYLRQLTDYVRTLVPGVRSVYLHYYKINHSFSPDRCDAQPGDPVGCIPQVPPHDWDTYGMAMQLMALREGAIYLDISHTRDWSTLQLPPPDDAHLTAEGHRLFELDLRTVLAAAP